MFKKLLFSVIAFSAIFLHSRGQSLGQMAPSSNTVSASIGNVSMFTGQPGIQIPLFSGGPTSMNLYYSANGVMPDVHPSSVGLGWNLSVGGQIIRTVKGIKDETPVYGYEFSYNKFNNDPNWSVESYLSQTSKQTADPDGNNKIDDVYDLEPDVFNFSFLGISGSFSFSEDGTIKVNSASPVKVVIEENSRFTPNYFSRLQDKVDPTYQTITIIDDRGYKYEFGNGAYEFSDYLNFKIIAMPDDLVSDLTVNNWKLNKVISPEGEVIARYTYFRGPYQINISRSLNDQTFDINGQVYYGEDADEHLTRDFYSATIASPVYLDQIWTKGNKYIKFFYSESKDLDYSDSEYGKVMTVYSQNQPGELSGDGKYYSEVFGTNTNLVKFYPIDHQFDKVWDKTFRLKLDRIELKHNSDRYKSIEFDYSNNFDGSKRLELQTVRFLNSQDEIISKYDLDYYSYGLLSPYLKMTNDHWGYANDLTNRNLFEDRECRLTIMECGLKDPTHDLNLALDGTLKSITYPSGGKTTYFFEQHKYKGEVNSLSRSYSPLGLEKNAGGLRISKIQNDDNNGNVSTIEYLYVKGYDGINYEGSSGILEFIPKYDITGTGITNLSKQVEFEITGSYPVVPSTSNYHGSHVTYSEVVEKRADGAFTIYKFSNHDNGYGDSQAIASFNGEANLTPTYVDNGYKRGHLLSKSTFKVDDTTQPIQRTEIEYSIYNPNAIIKNVRQVGYNINDNDFVVSKTAYHTFIGKFLPSKKKSFVFDGQQEMSNETIFQYNTLGQITSVSSKTIDGDLEEKKFTYAYEDNSLISSKNMLSVKSKTESYLNGQLLNTNRVEFLESDEFPGNIYPSRVTSQLGENGQIVESMVIDEYDQYGNVLQATSRSGKIVSYLYNYNFNKPKAIVENAKNFHSYITVYNDRTDFLLYSAPQSSGTFTNATQSDITVSLRNTPDLTYNENLFVQISGGGITRNTTLCKGCINYPESKTFTSLPAGTYTVTLSSINPMNASIAIDYKVAAQEFTGTVEFYFEDFESNSSLNFNRTISFGAHTGRYASKGSFTFEFEKPNSKNYFISYWYLENGNWKFSGEQPLVTNANNEVVLSGATAFDDIRVYPENAVMITKTYHPVYGISSQTDINNITVYYEYDDSGRLKYTRDQDGNILQINEYNTINK
ncbi:hypothetical protein [Marinigracilibium pacificum]|uniref:YD repeat-containing protein n=1 Tax=Marinigracilibium pacificum TaxID=2729599 RepID=A0A848J4V9_9BACT|nr:hypothetical protein [Marinigracilibium pacificum]NMM49494.1 hypothetical protein [Marinigracilibium pacificum]